MNEQAIPQNPQASTKHSQHIKFASSLPHAQEPQPLAPAHKKEARANESNQDETLRSNSGGMIDDSEFHYEHMEFHFNDDEDEGVGLGGAAEGTQSGEGKK